MNRYFRLGVVPLCLMAMTGIDVLTAQEPSTQEPSTSDFATRWADGRRDSSRRFRVLDDADAAGAEGVAFLVEQFVEEGPYKPEDAPFVLVDRAELNVRVSRALDAGKLSDDQLEAVLRATHSVRLEPGYRWSRFGDGERYVKPGSIGGETFFYGKGLHPSSSDRLMDLIQPLIVDDRCVRHVKLHRDGETFAEYFQRYPPTLWRKQVSKGSTSSDLAIFLWLQRDDVKALLAEPRTQGGEFEVEVIDDIVIKNPGTDRNVTVRFPIIRFTALLADSETPPPPAADFESRIVTLAGEKPHWMEGDPITLARVAALAAVTDEELEKQDRRVWGKVTREKHPDLFDLRDLRQSLTRLGGTDSVRAVELLSRSHNHRARFWVMEHLKRTVYLHPEHKPRLIEIAQQYAHNPVLEEGTRAQVRDWVQRNSREQNDQAEPEPTE